MPKANFLSYFASEAVTISLQIERFSMIKSKEISFLSYPTPPAEITQGSTDSPRRDYTGLNRSSPQRLHRDQAILPLLLPSQVIYRQRGAVRQILLGKNIGNIVFHGSFRDKKLVCYLLV